MGAKDKDENRCSSLQEIPRKGEKCKPWPRVLGQTMDEESGKF